MNADKQVIADTWADLLNAPNAHAALMAAVAPGGTNVFCKDWPTAKSVLQSLQPIVPQPGPIIIGIIISLGDAAYQHVCPGN